MIKDVDQKAGTFRFPKRSAPYVFAFYMAAIVAFLMCLVITATQFGIDDAYVERVLHAYRVAMPTAFVCVVIVRPIVVRLVARTVRID